MKITHSDPDCIIVYTPNGCFHITEEQGATRIQMYDHFNMLVTGKHKECPTVVLDTDEFPTRLEIKEIERKWLALRDQADRRKALSDPLLQKDKEMSCRYHDHHFTRLIENDYPKNDPASPGGIDREVLYTMVLCTKCGATKEVIARDYHIKK